MCTMRSRSPSSPCRYAAARARAVPRVQELCFAGGCGAPRVGPAHARAGRLKLRGVQVAVEAADVRTAADLKELFIATYNAKFGQVRA